MSVMLIILYICCSSIGLVLLKLGMSSGTIIMINSPYLEIKFHYLLILGGVLYVLSFLLNLLVMSKFNLSYIYPLSAGLIYIAILIFCVIILKEKINMVQFIGMGLILVGVVIMNLNK